MARKDKVESVDIVITIEVGRDYRQASTVSEAVREASDLVAAYKRHVASDFFKAAEPEIRPHRVRVCEHCDSQWTEDASDYNGGCCLADQDAEDQRLDERAKAEAEAEQRINSTAA